MGTRWGEKDVPVVDPSEDIPYWIPFRIHDGELHPSRYWFFQRSWDTYLAAFAKAGLSIDHVECPEAVGKGRVRDTAFLVCRATGSPRA